MTLDLDAMAEEATLRLLSFISAQHIATTIEFKSEVMRVRRRTENKLMDIRDRTHNRLDYLRARQAHKDKYGW
jgi:hypothetical protein